jgi:phage baseplate assembly protein W
MPSYIGFSTLNIGKPQTTNLPSGPQGGTGSVLNSIVYGKKYRTVDEQLVIQDFINAMNIQQGQKVGNPGYGTTLWSFVFEPNTADVQIQLELEIRRVASLDPRMLLNNVTAFPYEQGILIEVELAIAPFNNAQTLGIFLNNNNNTAALQ